MVLSKCQPQLQCDADHVSLCYAMLGNMQAPMTTPQKA